MPEGEANLCGTCLKPMPVGAAKCTECDSYQDWRRFLGFAAPVLSLLVALVAVLTASVPVVVSALTPKDSRLLFSYQGYDLNGFRVFVTNTGVRPGFVTGGIVTSDRLPPETMLALIPKGREGIIVEPGKSVLISMKRMMGTMINPPEKVPLDLLSGRCFVEFRAQNFTQTVTTKSFETNCSSLATETGMMNVILGVQGEIREDAPPAITIIPTQ